MVPQKVIENCIGTFEGLGQNDILYTGMMNTWNFVPSLRSHKEIPVRGGRRRQAQKGARVSVTGIAVGWLC